MTSSRQRLHTLYFSEKGRVQDYYSVYKIMATRDAILTLRYLLYLIFGEDAPSYYVISGYYVKDNEYNVTANKHIVVTLDQDRISTPRGNVYIPPCPKEGTIYIQTDKQDLALVLLDNIGQNVYEFVTDIYQHLAFVNYRYQNKK